MKNILLIMVFCLWLMACKTKQTQIKNHETKQIEINQASKDSVVDQKKERKISVFELDNSQSVEIELESDKDSTGQSKTLEFERIHSPTSEKIIVKGGKIKLKSVGKTYMSSAQKDTVQVDRTSVKTNKIIQKTTENKSFQKQKEVKTQGFTFWNYLYLIFWLLALGALIFLIWKYKLFQGFIAVLTKFKKYLTHLIKY